MNRAYLISPYRSDTVDLLSGNVAYAKRCAHYLFAAGWAPFASHIAYAASGWLDDNDPKDRAFGVVGK